MKNINVYKEGGACKLNFVTLSKDELLKKLLECDEIPKYLKNEVEDNLKDNDHYRALSPLTLSHVNRLEVNSSVIFDHAQTVTLVNFVARSLQPHL